MEALLLYQIKVAFLVATFLLGYRLLLRSETFYGFNRIVLIIMALLSFALPFFQITRDSTMFGNLFERENNKTKTEDVVSIVPNQTVAETTSTAVVVNNDNSITVPAATAVQTEMEENTAGSIAEQSSTQKNKTTPLTILCILYVIGVLFVLVKKAVSLWSMSRIIKKGRYADRNDGCDVIESNQIPQPVNWMRFIVMPKEWLEHQNQSVWEHENLHARRWHSLDLLMADVISALQWFNPFVAVFRKELELVHEYEADKAVLDSGASARDYKIMLISAVASSRGFVMTNWLKQSNLKKRIDMMDKKQSRGINRLKVLFIPAIAYLFLFATANEATAIDSTFRWPVFEDGKTWIFQDGTAKVRTFDGVVANMKVSEVADYLDHYKDFETTRMTLMYTYPIGSLKEVQPLAEQLNKVGIKVSVANNEEMLAQMTKPEYRTAKIFDEGDGLYRFELECNKQDDLIYHYYSRGETELPHQNVSIKGNIDLMKKWINLFDGHGVAIYPKTMPYSDLQQLAETAWKRDINIVSAITNNGDEFDNLITLIPKGSKWSSDYKGRNAAEVIAKVNASRTTDHFDKGLHIEDPQCFYVAERYYLIKHLVKKSDQLVLVLKPELQSGTWWMADKIEIEVDGKIYEATKYEGTNGFEETHYWVPCDGSSILTYYFDVSIPDDVQTINVHDDGNVVIEGLQVTERYVENSDFRVKNVYASASLQTTHREGDGLTDYVTVNRVDFGSNMTKFYVTLHIYQSHSFMGYVGSDITLTLSDSTVLRPIEVIGIPTDQEFDRHGDWMVTYFQVVFPAIEQETWEAGEAVMKMNVCHEPVTIAFKKYDIDAPIMNLTKEIQTGRYSGIVTKRIVIEASNGKKVGVNTLESENLYVEIDENYKMTVSGGNSLILPDGKYSLSWIGDKKFMEKTSYTIEEIESSAILQIKGKGAKKNVIPYAYTYKDKLLGYELRYTDDDNNIYKIELTPLNE